jgi:hypothetical protein
VPFSNLSEYQLSICCLPCIIINGGITVPSATIVSTKVSDFRSSAVAVYN